VPASHRLGAEGEGFKIGMRTLDRLRATVAAAACGMAERALDEALAHARARRQFGRPLADQQLVQAKLATMATELAAARLLTYRAAAEADRVAAAGSDERVTLESSMAKYHATETAQRIVDAAVQVLGGRGVLIDSPVDRLYRAVRALRIYEGATEVQQLVIARQLLARVED
jgi:acyl-CoA dehydrogenase